MPEHDPQRRRRLTAGGGRAPPARADSPAWRDGAVEEQRRSRAPHPPTSPARSAWPGLAPFRRREPLPPAPRAARATGETPGSPSAPERAAIDPHAPPATPAPLPGPRRAERRERRAPAGPSSAAPARRARRPPPCWCPQRPLRPLAAGSGPGEGKAPPARRAAAATQPGPAASGPAAPLGTSSASAADHAFCVGFISRGS
ncbi:skin secretory protein xP2-like [Melozone crissalis]|uniref:skin secretory protein xP2-like n=1 Tax=Melozone crissalis TaxID=40204 RepID=UPI0023DC3CA1|nr:skin secretory protein xP2-like [Melozone crissalis]